MKRLLCSFICVITLALNTAVFADEIYREDESFKAPSVDAEAAVLADMKTGRVIYSKNPDEELYPASTTKILTGILALELGKLDDVVTADVASLAPITNEDSHMGILIGEQLTMEQLINGMLVYSANDAANIIATHISGTSEKFVELMNTKAREIGTTHTNFTNAYGIHDANHYTSASDLALMARYAMQNEKFREIVAQKIYTIPPTNKYTTERNLPSTNLFLGTARSPKFYNKSVTGIKTGHTSDAGYCLVTSAKKEDTELLCVVLKCKNQDASYNTTKALLDYGFTNYKNTTVVKAGDAVTDSKVIEAKNDQRLALTVSEDIMALLPSETDISESVETVYDIPENLRAPVTKGDVIGSVSYNYKGTMIGHADLIAANDVERNNLLFIFNMIVLVLTSPFFFIPAILLIIILIIRRINIRKQEKLKRMRRLHERESDRIMRSGSKTPVNTRFKDTSNKRNPNSRYKK